MKPAQIKVFFLILLVTFSFAAAFAQEETKVVARLDSRVVSIDDLITLRVTITSNIQIQDYSVDFPNLKDFTSLSETSSRNYSQFNAQINISYSFIYSLSAKRKGNLSIPGMTVTVDGKKYRTQPLSLRVIESTLGDEIIIRFVPDKLQAFIGEQIELRTELLFTDRNRISNYDSAEQSNFEGFIIIDDTNLGRNPPVTRVEFKGKSYYAATLRKQVLFPLSQGRKTLNPLSLRIQYRKVGIGAPLKVSTIKTKIINLTIKPLPSGAPEEFKGAVGKYELDWSIDRLEGKANEPFTLKVELRGIGDIQRVPEVPLNLPEEFEIIDATSNSDAELRQGFWAGSKTWEYIVIPKTKGTKTLGPVSVSYFDPELTQYLTATSTAITLEVAEGEKQAQLLIPTMPQAEAVEGDIRFIKTSAVPLGNQQFSFIGSLWFWLLLGAVPALNIVILLLKKLISIRPADVAGLKHKNALDNAIKELEAIGKIPEEQREKALSVIRTIIVGYFKDKLELPHADMSFSEIRSELVRFDLHESPEADRLNRILDMCEADKFAPVQEKKLTIRIMAKSVLVDLQEVDKKI